MAISLHNLKPAKGATKSSKRLGRGNSSGKGNYSGKGMKGQKARSGGKGRLYVVGMKSNILNIPKLPGFKSLKQKAVAVTTGTLDVVCKNGDIVSPGSLVAREVISSAKFGVKIINTGAITKKITIKGCKISAGAKEAIEKAGGKVIILGETATTDDKETKGKK
jgi:large subunit ribosomal protein L15